MAANGPGETRHLEVIDLLAVEPNPAIHRIIFTDLDVSDTDPGVVEIGEIGDASKTFVKKYAMVAAACC